MTPLSMEDRSPQVLAVNIIFWILSWLAVGLRIYVRAFMRKSFGVDDWLMVVTQIFFSAYLACQLGGVIYGTGRHYADNTVANIEKALRFWWFCEIFVVITACVLKVSVACFLLRITIRKIHIWILRLMALSTMIFGFFYLLLAFLQCRPISAWWTVARKGCIDPQIVVDATYAASVLNAIADWTFGILPIFIVRDLNMSRRMKLIVAGILGFAAIGSTATVIRIPFIPTLGNNDDFLWVTTEFAIFSTVELGTGIVAACTATLRPLLSAIVDRTRGSSYKDTPNEQSRMSKGQQGKVQRSISLDHLRTNAAPITTTAVCAEGGDGPDKAWDRKISSDLEALRIHRSVVTTVTEARLDTAYRPGTSVNHQVDTTDPRTEHRRIASDPADQNTGKGRMKKTVAQWQGPL